MVNAMYGANNSSLFTGREMLPTGMAISIASTISSKKMLSEVSVSPITGWA